MIDGMWWLVILFAVIAVLWLLAKLRGEQPHEKQPRGAAADETHDRRPKGTKNQTNDALQKTAALFKQYFSEYHVTQKTNHLLVSKHGKKIAMITIDKKIAKSQRRLGGLPVINYHRVPSRAQLSANLQEAE